MQVVDLAQAFGVVQDAGQLAVARHLREFGSLHNLGRTNAIHLNDTHPALAPAELMRLLLDEHGVYVQPIDYPTVERGTERFRITTSPLHTDADVDTLIAGLADVWERLELPRAGELPAYSRS